MSKQNAIKNNISDSYNILNSINLDNDNLIKYFTKTQDFNIINFL